MLDIQKAPPKVVLLKVTKTNFKQTCIYNQYLFLSGIPTISSGNIIFHSAVAVNDQNEYLTNGGRVLIAVSLQDDLRKASIEALKIVQGIDFTDAGAQYRTDIAEKAFKM